MTYDCLTIGNSVIDAFLTLPENQHLTVNRHEKTLSVPFGAKIELAGCEFLLGGNATNVAVGLRRAGFSTSLIAELADDEFSEKILNGLKREKVDTEHIMRSKGQSSFSIALNVKGERTLFVEHQERAHNFHFDHIEAECLYLTSLGNKWEHVYARVAQYLQIHPQVQLAFNPGSLQVQAGLHSFAYLLPLTTLLFLNKEEAEHLLRKSGEVKELLLSLKDKGVTTVIITDGERGSYCIDAQGRVYHQECLKVPVVERTGAGDAYATGFAAGFLKRQPIETCMLWGTHNAASVIGQVGAQSGLLHADELQSKQ